MVWLSILIIFNFIFEKSCFVFFPIGFLWIGLYLLGFPGASVTIAVKKNPNSECFIVGFGNN